jgi:hypothetical protein
MLAARLNVAVYKTIARKTGLRSSKQVHRQSQAISPALDRRWRCVGGLPSSTDGTSRGLGVRWTIVSSASRQRNAARAITVERRWESAAGDVKRPRDWPRVRQSR